MDPLDQAYDTIQAILDPRTGPIALLKAAGYKGTADGRKQFGSLHDQICHFHHDNQLSSVVVPRGHGKTTIGSVGANAHALILDPAHRILAPSASLDLARKIVGETRALLSGSLELAPGIVLPLAEIFPWAVPDNPQEKQGPCDAFNVVGRTGLGREPSMYAASPKSSLAGNRFTRATPDDITNEQNSRTFARRQQNIDFMEQLTPIKYLPTSPISMSSTPWAFNDTTAWAAAQPGWAQLRYGCWDGAVLDPQLPAGGGPGPQGAWPLCESFLNAEELIRYQLTHSATFFASQYLCAPLPSDVQVFPDEVLLPAQIPPGVPLPRGSGDLLLWDPVATLRGQAPDRNGLLLFRVCRKADLPSDFYMPENELEPDRNVFICHGAWEIAGGSADARDFIERMIREGRWPGLRCIWVEDVAAQNLLAPWLKDRGQLMGVEIRGERIPAKNLEFRLQSLPTAMRRGQLLFMPEFEGRNLILARLSEYPASDYDDLPAAMALLANHWEQWGDPPGMEGGGDGRGPWGDPRKIW